MSVSLSKTTNYTDFTNTIFDRNYYIILISVQEKICLSVFRKICLSVLEKSVSLSKKNLSLCPAIFGI